MKFRNLSRYQTGRRGSVMDLTLPLPKTPDGRVYRYSPNEEAEPRHFVLGEVKAEIELTPEIRARMKLEPHSTQSVCPYSGVIDDAQAFTHPEDHKAALKMVEHAAIADVEEALNGVFKDLNRRSSRNSFIQIKAEVKNTRRLKPRFSRRDLMRELVCDHCGRDYGVFAIGLFCPDCGAPNLRLHFAREAELVGDQVGMADQLGDGKEELAYRLLGNAHEDVLTAFEATLKTVFLYGFRTQKPGEPAPKIGNDFQNIERARKRFEMLGFDPFERLTDAEFAALELNIQKRHIIGHNLGVVDGKFAKHAADAKIGETVHLVGEDIRIFAALGQKVIDRLDSWLAGSNSPNLGLAPVMSQLPETTPRPDDPLDLMKLDLELGLLARKIAVWAAQHDPDARGRFVDIEQLKSAFSESDEAELAEAIAELQTDGFVQSSPTFGSRLHAFRCRADLFATFDPVAIGSDPVADSVTLAEAALECDGAVSSPKIIEQLGWTVRRFNPALELVVAHIPDGRVSRTNDPQFAVRSFWVLPEDRVTLKRYIARMTK